MEEKENELIRLLSVELLRVQCLQLIIGLAIHFHSCDVSSNRIEPYCDEMFKITIEPELSCSSFNLAKGCKKPNISH